MPRKVQLPVEEPSPSPKSGEAASPAVIAEPEVQADPVETRAETDPVEPEPQAPHRGWRRTGKAVNLLAGAMRQDLLAASRETRTRLAASARSARGRIRLEGPKTARDAWAAFQAWVVAMPGRLRLWFGRQRHSPPLETSTTGRRHPWLKGALGTAALGVVAVAAIMVWALRDVPWGEIAEGSLTPVVVLESADGAPLVQQGPFQGAYAARADFPPQLVDAVLSTEDQRFYGHYGVDFRGILRASIRNLMAGEVVEGGSTITQQLIKISYLESERTWKRKVQEVVIAVWLEAKLGKDEILTRYLNNIYLGAGATGVPAAARIYFDKEVSEIDLMESAILAGLIRAPSQLNPIENPEGARERAAVVLGAMVGNGKIEQAQADAANLQFAQLRPTKEAARSGSWFSDWMFEEAREIAGPFRGTIKVRTSLVPRLQAIAEAAVRETMDAEGEALGASQAALVAMTPDGAVVAMVGGRDYADSEFNRAVTAMRQPGSTFKLFVFYAALKAGFGLGDRVDDRPIEIDGWEPENIGGDYAGRVSLAEAFARSLNAATVALSQEVGIDKVIAAAKELGIDARLEATPSLALGTSEVSLLDLTGAYASVRAGVAPIEPWGIVSFQADGQPRPFRVGPAEPSVSDLGAYQKDLVDLLQLVVERGTGKGAAIDGFAAGKTGTSQNHRDAWFIGFTEPLVAGVWVGNDDDTPMKDVTGGKLPAAIWKRFMEAALSEAGANQPAVETTASTAEPETAQEPEASCNVRACSRAYRSFRASDCSYQPYRGSRKICER